MSVASVSVGKGCFFLDACLAEGEHCTRADRAYYGSSLNLRLQIRATPLSLPYTVRLHSHRDLAMSRIQQIMDVSGLFRCMLRLQASLAFLFF